MTTFLCYNCCDPESPSGEACFYTAETEAETAIIKDHILHGRTPCVKNYRNVLSDFYIISTDEGKQLLKNIEDSILWDKNYCNLKITLKRRS